MKRVIVVILVAMALVNASNAFAYWKSPIGLKINDPAPCPFENNKF